MSQPATVPFLLASGSPRRADLLSSAGLDFTVSPVNCDETWRSGEAPIQYAERIATAKAEAATGTRAGTIVLGADTVVWIALEGPPLQKPHDRGHAREQLRLLATGQPHFVTTGYAFIDARHAPARLVCAHETTRVWMRKLDDDELEAYLDTGEWQDKAGGYGIQGRAAGLVVRIEGSYTNVVGLPLSQVIEAIRELSQRGAPQ